MSDLEQILDNKGIEYRRTPNNPSEILIHCTSGLHDDNNPSLSYNLDNNIFKCWSCGFSGSHHKFLKSIGIIEEVEITTKQEYKIRKLKKKFNQKLLNTLGARMPSDRTNYFYDFKGISAKIMEEFKAFTTSESDLANYICVPIYQYGKLCFVEGRYKLLNSQDKSKYNRKPDGAIVRNVLFPLDKLAISNDSIILVEGLFDMLNLWQLGYYNTLCIFGTANFGKDKVTIIDDLGVRKVFIMMDGDVAGKQAAKNISILLEKEDIETKTINLATGEDPGELTLQQAKYYLKGV